MSLGQIRRKWVILLAKEKAPEANAPEALTTSEDSICEKVNQAKAEFNSLFAESLKGVPDDGAWSDSVSFDASDRKRGWWFLLYPESMNPNALQILSESTYQGAISPLHDKDLWPTGDPKKPHFHVLIYVSGKVSYNSLMPLVNAVNGIRLQPVGSIIGASRYLAHMDIDPERIFADKGKVHYSPDDIVTFGGFDVKSFLKATQTQISKALRELYGFIESEGITSYYEFVNWIYSEKPEYHFLMANPQVTAQVDRYIRSKFAVLHFDDENKALRKAFYEGEEQLRKSWDAVNRMESMMTQLLSTLGGVSNVKH